jgi:hypothetical protein
MWCRRTAALAAAVVAGCAALAPMQQDFDKRLAAVLEGRALGADALLVIDNLLRHGPPAPRATPALVRELLARPLDAADAAALFRQTVPQALADLASPAAGAASFDDLLKTYLEELAEAQRLLRAASAGLPDEAILRALEQGLPFPRELVAIADAVDTAQLERANRLFVEATIRFARGIRYAADWPSEPRKFQSAIGPVVIGTRGDDRYGPEAALIIDPGGDDVYERAPARGGAVSVIIDLAGNDQYRGSDTALRGLSAIVDFAGDDRYEMETGVAAAIVGAALLIDFSGNDSYAANFFGQGAAAFGIGALVDLAGDDRYRLEAWGQGLGLAGGLGLLWDRGGNDHYAAGGVPDPYDRGSGVSAAQGVGFGFRERIAGGIGILRDDGGDDVYEAQMFAQGAGYYYGLGLLWDRGGADRYQAFRYAQGNGAHQAIGVLRDEAGNDRYSLNDAYGQGMGLDIAVGILVDFLGDDVYRAHAAAQGTATANGFGLLADQAGNDRFDFGADQRAWGRAEWLRGLPSVGVLLHGSAAHFSRDGKPVPVPPENPPLAVQPPTADTCTSQDPGEALLCRLRETRDVDPIWGELEVLLAAEAMTPAQPRAERIATLLSKHQSCNVRALALRAWPTLPAAQEGLRSSCWRLQAAARAAFTRLGAQLPGDAALPSFLRRIPPQEDTF